MEYNFKIQKKLLSTALRLLKEKDLLEISAFGGGTALASLYWNHRYSTDIDIFIYGEKDKISELKPRYWNDKSKKAMNKIGYINGNIKFNGIYLEYEITKDYKIQFLDVVQKTNTPYSKQQIWHHKINVESIEEIIAKKIFFRADKGNARDLFDIAVAFHKNPQILNLMDLPIRKIKLLIDTIDEIKNDDKLSKEYLNEIKQMNPNIIYDKLSKCAINYLYDIVLTHYIQIQENKTLTPTQCDKLESVIYKKYC